MTFREAYHATPTWQRKVALVSLFHNARLNENKLWTISETAEYFKISIGSISESMKLSKHWDLIKDCKSKNEALQKIKK